MAKCVEKQNGYKSVNELPEHTTILDMDESPTAAKKLKQARLPFKPIGPKSQITVTPCPIQKKRKLSDQESPSAKAPKINKHQSDRGKHEINEKAKLDFAEHENEVSSSSEAENVPLSGLGKRKFEANSLEKFIRKTSQEEISSTNEVIDLTENVTENANMGDTDLHGGEVTSSKTASIETESPIIDVSENVEMNDEIEINQEQKKEVIEDSELTAAENVESVNKIDAIKQIESKSVKVALVRIDSVTTDEKSAVKPEEKEAAQNNVGTLEDNDSDDDKSDLEISIESTSSTSESTEDKSLDESNEDINDSIADISVNEYDGSVADISASSHVTSPATDSSTCKTPSAKSKDASTCKTPGGSTLQTSTPKNELKKPRSLKLSEIKRQEQKQEREAMRKRIREQKEQQRRELKEKKEQERLEAKQKREDEKTEKEKKKKEEKEKRENERREKKEQLEKDKLEKQQQKEEEKKRKQEQIDAKMDEKKRKEEEKRLKEEEKHREEEEKMKKQMKEKQTFSKFFIKKATQQAAKTKEQCEMFMPFEVKKDMTVAPTVRRNLEEEDITHLEQHLLSQDCPRLYIEEVTNPTYKKRSSPGLAPRQEFLPETQEEEDEEEEEDVKCTDVVDDNERKNLVRQRCKLLQFHTNYRPPYYGTWRKKSGSIKPRRPFSQDTDLFDYEVDSDDEWEEEEPGESVSSSEDEGDDKEEEQEEEDEDGWMVPHGYLSEDEGCQEDEEITPEVLKARQMAKQEAWEAEQKRQKQPVKCIVIGCVWDGDDVASNIAAKLALFQAVCLSAVPIDLKAKETAPRSKEGEKTPAAKGKRKPVPEEAMPDLIRLIHGNMLGMKKLIKEFRLFWKKRTSGGDTDGDQSQVEPDHNEKETSVLDESCTEKTEKDVDMEGDEKQVDVADGCGISKRQLEMKIMKIAARERRADVKKVCWYVHESVLKQYDMVNITLPNTWQYVSKGLIKVKNEEACGRKTPNNLSESFTDSVAVIMKEDTASEEGEPKPLPRDQPSIMQFAKKMLPSELPKPKFRRIELKPVNPKPAASSVKETPAVDLDSSANEETLKPYKVLPKDQRSIMDFAKTKVSKTSPKTPASKQVQTVSANTATEQDSAATSSNSREVTPINPVSEPVRVAKPSPAPQCAAKEREEPMEAEDSSDCILID